MREIEQVKYLGKYLEVLEISLKEKNEMLLRAQTMVGVLDQMVDEKDAAITQLQAQVNALTETANKVDPKAETKE